MIEALNSQAAGGRQALAETAPTAARTAARAPLPAGGGWPRGWPRGWARRPGAGAGVLSALRSATASALATGHASLASLEAARGHLFPFAPVCIGVGVAIYFSLPVEPEAMALAGAGAAGLALFWAALRGTPGWRILAAGAALVLLGLIAGGLRAGWVAAPVIEGRFYGAIEGRIVGIDRSAGDDLRLTLDRVVLEGRDPRRVPERVRVALHGGAGDGLDPVPGMRVGLTGHLMPPPAPAEPGGFDFRRQAFFARLGAVGYTRAPVVETGPPEATAALAVTQIRLAVSAAVQARVPGEAGGFAAAILTGDRSGVSAATTEALRASNLAHLLAISGLHMGLLTGFVFLMLRGAAGLVPALALRWDTRKPAAIGALAAGAVYLAMSGGNVATERAYVMVAVMLVAVLIGRRAISLRSVALAGVILLLLRPEELLSAGFQMSFAATVALVAVFGALRERRALALRAGQLGGQGGGRNLPWWASRVGALVLCSLVAGLATAPVAAAQFNRMADYGLLANILAVPLMGSVVIPAAVIAALVAPLGLAWLPLWAMEMGARWILAVAEWVAGLDGAVRAVADPPGWALPLLVLGALWLVLWPFAARWVGLAAMAVALAGWPTGARPPVLIAGSGSVIGLMQPGGRALVGGGEGFAVRSWLAADGDAATPEAARDRAAAAGLVPGEALGRIATAGAGGDLLLLRGRGAAAALDEACRDGRLIVLAADLPGRWRRAEDPFRPWPESRPACAVADARSLAASGAVALWPGTGGPGFRPGDRPVIRTVAATSGQRWWSDRTLRDTRLGLPSDRGRPQR